MDNFETQNNWNRQPIRDSSSDWRSGVSDPQTNRLLRNRTVAVYNRILHNQDQARNIARQKQDARIAARQREQEMDNAAEDMITMIEDRINANREQARIRSRIYANRQRAIKNRLDTNREIAHERYYWNRQFLPQVDEGGQVEGEDIDFYLGDLENTQI